MKTTVIIKNIIKNKLDNTFHSPLPPNRNSFDPSPVSYRAP